VSKEEKPQPGLGRGGAGTRAISAKLNYKRLALIVAVGRGGGRKRGRGKGGLGPNSGPRSKELVGGRGIAGKRPREKMKRDLATRRVRYKGSFRPVSVHWRSTAPATSPEDGCSSKKAVERSRRRWLAGRPVGEPRSFPPRSPARVRRHKNRSRWISGYRPGFKIDQEIKIRKKNTGQPGPLHLRSCVGLAWPSLQRRCRWVCYGKTLAKKL